MNFRKYKLPLVLATTVFIVVGCGFRSTATDPAAVEAQFEAAKQDERQLLTAIVEDPERTNTLLMLLDERNQTVANHAATVETYINNMRTLNADYDAERADFELLFAAYRTDRQTYQQNLVNIIQQMKANTTAKEWKRLAKFQLNELNPRAMTTPAGGA